MICVSDFLTTLFKNILEKPVASDRYVSKYNISRNNFIYYINTNHLMSPNVAHGLCNIVLDTIKEFPEKESDILNYFSSFLTVKEKDHLTEYEIIRAAIAKFTNTSTGTKKNRIRAVSFQDVSKMNRDIKDFFVEVMRLDSEEIENLTQEHAGELDKWVALASELPETWRGFCDASNKIVGYWSFKPLFDKYFIRAKEGLLFDGELNLQMMPVLVSGTYNIYFVEICLNKQYKRTAFFRLVLNSICEAIENLAGKEIFIDEICTLAYSTDGKRLCKSLGLKYHKKHVESGDIYCGSIKDLLEKPFCRNFYALKRLYNQHNISYV